MKTGALVLAAGKASRFGSPKQLLEIEGVSLIDRACLTALEAGCDPVLRILGAHAGEISSRACPPGVDTLYHAAWEEGMGSSLAAGMRFLLGRSAGLDGVLLLLADQPGVTAGLLHAMFAELRPPGISMVLSNYGTACGPPSLFAAKHFAELARLSADQGAKALVPKHASAVARVPFPEGAWDIDSPEVWEEFTRARAASSATRYP